MAAPPMATAVSPRTASAPLASSSAAVGGVSGGGSILSAPPAASAKGGRDNADPNDLFALFSQEGAESVAAAALRDFCAAPASASSASASGVGQSHAPNNSSAGGHSSNSSSSGRKSKEGQPQRSERGRSGSSSSRHDLHHSSHSSKKHRSRHRSSSRSATPQSEDTPDPGLAVEEDEEGEDEASDVSRKHSSSSATPSPPPPRRQSRQHKQQGGRGSSSRRSSSPPRRNRSEGERASPAAASVPATALSWSPSAAAAASSSPSASPASARSSKPDYSAMSSESLAHQQAFESLRGGYDDDFQPQQQQQQLQFDRASPDPPSSNRRPRPSSSSSQQHHGHAATVPARYNTFGATDRAAVTAGYGVQAASGPGAASALEAARTLLAQAGGNVDGELGRFLAAQGFDEAVAARLKHEGALTVGHASRLTKTRLKQLIGVGNGIRLHMALREIEAARALLRASGESVTGSFDGGDGNSGATREGRSSRSRGRLSAASVLPRSSACSATSTDATDSPGALLFRTLHPPGLHGYCAVADCDLPAPVCCADRGCSIGLCTFHVHKNILTGQSLCARCYETSSSALESIKEASGFNALQEQGYLQPIEQCVVQ